MGRGVCRVGRVLLSRHSRRSMEEQPALPAFARLPPHCRCAWALKHTQSRCPATLHWVHKQAQLRACLRDVSKVDDKCVRDGWYHVPRLPNLRPESGSLAWQSAVTGCRRHPSCACLSLMAQASSHSRWFCLC